MAGASGQFAATTHIRGRVGSYHVLEQIGEGGMGVVYLAQDEALGRNVALKVLAPTLSGNVEFRARFVRESRLAAAIDHPNIIPVYEAGDVDGQLFIAMRYVRGIDLRRLLAIEGPLQPQRAVDIVDQVARALDAAHRDQLVHRDVKPANVMIDQSEGREHCYLTDFGLTKSTAASSGYTATGHFVGTLNYMAPEQIEGRRVDGRADIYALGCMLFECLTGSVPFPRDSEVAMMYAHLHEPPPSPCELRPELPPSVDAVLARAMAKAPLDRHATCCDVVAELRAALAGVPIMPFEPSFVSTGPRFARAEPGATARQAPSAAAPPVMATPDAAVPPPKRRAPRFALIALAVVLLLAGGGIAAVVLTKKDEPSVTAQQQQAQERLLQRTVLLQRDLRTLAIKLKKDRGAASAATKTRIEKDRQEAKSLIAAARKEKSRAAGFANALEKANENFKQAADSMKTYAESGRPGDIRIFIDYIDRGGTGTKAAGSELGSGAPPIDTPPITGAGVPPVETPKLRLPDDALATIEAPQGTAITAVRSVGDVGGDDKDDVGVVTDDGTYVLFAGTGDGDLVLGDDIDSDRGVKLADATDIAPGGDGPLVTRADGTLALTPLSEDPTESADVIPLDGTFTNAAGIGDFDGDTYDDVLASDGATVSVLFGPDYAPEDSVEITGDVLGDKLSALADVNDDGRNDIAVSSADAAYVVFGPEERQPVDVSALDPETDGFAIEGAGDAGVTAPGDTNGDGTADLLVTTPDGTTLVSGSDEPGDLSLDDGQPLDEAIGTPAAAGNLDGDDSDDVLIPTSDGAKVLYGGEKLGKRELSIEAPADAIAVLGAVDFDGDDEGDVLVAIDSAVYVLAPQR